MRPALPLLCLLAACASSRSNELPPNAPMPANVTWAGAWSTTLGPLELQVPEDPALAAEAPFIGKATLSEHDGTLACKSGGDNHLYCAWDEWQGDQSVMSGVVVLVMNPDGAGFVANWGRGHGATVRLLGSR